MHVAPRRKRCWAGVCVFLIASGMRTIEADTHPQTAQTSENPGALKSLSLEELSQIEVTTPAKEPREAFKTPVAVYVITSEDIQRSGATSIPEALRLAPGV